MVRKMRSQLFENPCKSQQRKLCIYPNHEKKRRASSKEPGGDTQNSQEPTEETSGLVCVCSVMSNSLWLHGLQPAKLLYPWDFAGKNTGVGCHFLLQGIFSTQGSNRHLLHWSGFFTTEPHGKPLKRCIHPLLSEYFWRSLKTVSIKPLREENYKYHHYNQRIRAAIQHKQD